MTDPSPAPLDQDHSLAELPEMNPGPVCRLARDGTVELANRAARELFGVDDLAGRRWRDVCPGITDALWARVVDGATPVRLDARIGARDVTFAMVPPGTGAGVFVYGTDVTERNDMERALRQHERMATLGTLAAGLAHELNNPAAAARRAATHLREQFSRLQRAELALRAVVLDEDGRRELEEFADLSVARATQTGEFSALTRSDVEAALEEWLEAHDVDEPWELAGPLVDLGVGEERLAMTAARVGPGNLGAVLRWAVASFEVQSLFAEVQQAATRLSEIVGAMKAYSFVGQAPLQAVDVNEGLRNTLIIMRSKLKAGVTVVQHLDEALRPIQAYGGDLNQVWTNLIDNAVAAMGGEGTLTLRTAPREGGVVVEVEDDGPGIPAADKARIFDAFFTTKPPGQGTGLGLHTVYNIVVKKHGGTIDVASEPGRTRFIVTLPPVCPNSQEGD
ncbi:MAG: ATP-binding protein [Gemmatimonadota bacterium]|nr:ATP-binding protein [Gemmatimonadota bacterium]